MKMTSRPCINAHALVGRVQYQAKPDTAIKGEEFVMKVISTENAPKAIGPYSQAIEANGLVFASGQIPINPAVGKIEAETIEEQAEQACKNVKAIMEAAGLGMENVVKTTCLLADINDFKAFDAVYEKYFVSKPARSCFAVKDIPAGALVEIEAVAAR